MTALLLILLLAVLAIALAAARWLAPAARLPLAAALALGLAGYAWQGVPAAPGAPAQRASSEPTRATGERVDRPLMGTVRRLDAATSWLMLANSMTRRGRTADAANIVRAGLKTYPRNADLWAGYGAALLEHGGGRLSPAASLAFARARALDPGHAAPDVYLGIAAIRAGDLALAERYWTTARNRRGADVELIAELDARIALVRRLRAAAREPEQTP